MLEVKKTDSESTANLIRRFSKKVRESGLVYRAKSLRFNARPKSKLKKKEEALKKAKKERRMAYLKKLGKID